MKTGYFLSLVLMVFVVFAIGYGFYYYENIKYKEKVFTYVNSCEEALLKTNRTYVICCENDGKLYLCNDKRVFKPGEYVGVQVNLQKLNKYFGNYYACAYQDFPIRDTELPKKYDRSYIKAQNVSGYKSFVCSVIFSKDNYHHIAISGYVEPIKGNYTLLKVWLFPPIRDYETIEDFKNNLDSAKLVLDLRGVIE